MKLVLIMVLAAAPLFSDISFNTTNARFSISATATESKAIPAFYSRAFVCMVFNSISISQSAGSGVFSVQLSPTLNGEGTDIFKAALRSSVNPQNAVIGGLVVILTPEDRWIRVRLEGNSMELQAAGRFQVCNPPQTITF